MNHLIAGTIFVALFTGTATARAIPGAVHLARQARPILS
jgi:hypothetical protein